MSELSLSRLGINGFRGLRSLDLHGLGWVNILIGANNSGKTSVLEALSLICQPSNPDQWLAMVRRRDFGGLDETRLQSLRWCFRRDLVSPDSDELVEAGCEFECDGRFPLRTLRVRYGEFLGVPSPEEWLRWRSPYRRAPDTAPETMRGAELVHYPDWTTLPGPTEFHGRQPAGPEQPTFKLWENGPAQFPRPARGARIDCETLTPYSYQTNRNQVRSQSMRIFQDDSPSVLELLRDFDPDIEGIDLASFAGDRPAIYIKHRRLGIAPLSIFGDAMRRSVLLAATLPTLKQGGVLLIDEVETGIHVQVLGRVFGWLAASARRLGVQLFVTTHSLEALDALVAGRSVGASEDVVAFHLAQTEDQTQCKRFSGDLLQRLRVERGLDLR
ncbi:hypothetical protein CKO25_00945 [Thiocapsa imhoffii]|uniref:DUF2813 domain-containing protein n=1 Tax=Thiocapsa imhoffii TaxID=382777 RepID=A0A9X0WEN4_9GAMM|nr:ATP-binding protein [Thiocapsa imhoffii]MBK1643242.1 hypothetical protein [Thiocapsa imhoffii]